MRTSVEEVPYRNWDICGDCLTGHTVPQFTQRWTTTTTFTRSSARRRWFVDIISTFFSLMQSSILTCNNYVGKTSTPLIQYWFDMYDLLVHYVHVFMLYMIINLYHLCLVLPINEHGWVLYNITLCYSFHCSSFTFRIVPWQTCCCFNHQCMKE